MANPSTAYCTGAAVAFTDRTTDTRSVITTFIFAPRRPNYCEVAVKKSSNQRRHWGARSNLGTCATNCSRKRAFSVGTNPAWLLPFSVTGSGTTPIRAGFPAAADGRFTWRERSAEVEPTGHKYHIDRAKRLPPNLLSPEFATIGKQCFEELVNVQRELFENLQETNRHWLERVQYEATLASKFATKLTTTHSV